MPSSYQASRGRLNMQIDRDNDFLKLQNSLTEVLFFMEKLGIVHIYHHDYEELNTLMGKFLTGVYWNEHEKRVHKEECEARYLGLDEEDILDKRREANERAARTIHRSMRRLHGYPITRI